ncbi:unnamed protein product [Adineta steineri]|uniref:Integral membrane bound transporter domain-containing protein n=1 Tax=Adineta steineri TaxID=433720 RepID=A0A819E3K9_9BILA|nr:unnamed protein product [Adineta steineri]
MSLSSVFQTFLHFYFNYHYVESASSYIHSTFARRVQFTLRIVISFLVGGFLAYKSPLSDQTSQGFLIPLISVMSLQETFGLTVAACFQMLLGLIPSTIFLFIVQKIGLGYHDYLAAELILLVSSFFIAFICSQSQTRKIPLVLCAIFFATIVNQRSIPSTFIFQLLETFVIGMAIAVLVSLTIFPVFATIDIENRVNYCLLNLQEMQKSITKAFLHQDKISAQISLTRTSTIEEIILTAIGPIRMKLVETRFEPSRFLQRIFNRRRRQIINLTIQEQDDLIMAWFLHVRSMELMVKQCRFNEYHRDLIQELEAKLQHICLCQSVIISTMTTSSSITKDEFFHQVSDLERAGEALRATYSEARLRRLEDALESAAIIQSEDYLSHSFFLFQFDSIIRLFTRIITTNVKKSVPAKKKQSLKDRLTPKWSRLFSATKCMIIVGIGSIFVMVSPLATAFENGQWIFVAICMTQGDSVGGAFTTMKMRLLGTLLGAMWAYVTYLAVHDDVYQTFGMLVPWILVFGYIRPLPKLNYTATVAMITPILITLGRIPYGNTLPAGNYALLRIEENLVGIGVAAVLTLIIFPVFAIDLLKDNIQSTFQACRDNINSIRLIYDQLFYNKHLNEMSIDIEKEEQNIQSFFDVQRSHISQLITIQRNLIEHASSEPSFWWVNNNCSIKRYKTLVQQEIDMFQIFYCIDTALMRIHECSTNNDVHIENIQIYPINDDFFSNFHTELTTLSDRLSECLNLWSSYFALTQRRSHRFLHHFICSKTKLVENDLLKHEQKLVELHEVIYRLQSQHQDAVHKIMEHYLDRLTQGDALSTFVPYMNNNETDSILNAISAMYFSTTELIRVALALGTSIHSIFELETTNRYAFY